MFCDSDDWVMEDYCSYMIEHVEDRHLVMCGFEEISDEQVKFVGKENTDKVEKILKKDIKTSFCMRIMFSKLLWRKKL